MTTEKVLYQTLYNWDDVLSWSPGRGSVAEYAVDQAARDAQAEDTDLGETWWGEVVDAVGSTIRVNLYAGYP